MRGVQTMNFPGMTLLPGLIEGQPDRLLGYPVIEAEDMPDIAADAYQPCRGAERDSPAAGRGRFAVADRCFGAG